MSDAGMLGKQRTRSQVEWSVLVAEHCQSKPCLQCTETANLGRETTRKTWLHRLIKKATRLGRGKGYADTETA